MGYKILLLNKWAAIKMECKYLDYQNSRSVGTKAKPYSTDQTLFFFVSFKMYDLEGHIALDRFRF